MIAESTRFCPKRLRANGWLASLMLTFGLMMVAGCSGSGSEKANSTSSDSSTTEVTPEPIVLGQYTPLTGSVATFGQSSANGVAIALEELNGAGGINGRPVEIITYDNQGKAQEAGTAVTRLITKDNVIAILGDVPSSLSLAGGDVAQQYGVPMISPASTNAKVTEIGDMIFRVCFVDSFQGYIAAKFLSENVEAKNVAILYDQQQAYSTGLRDDFTKAFESMGGTVVTTQAYSSGDTDFSAQISSILEKEPDAVYIPGYYTEVANIALQARRQGLTVPLMGGDGWDSPKLPEIAGEAIEGCYLSNHYSSEDTDPAVQEFVKKYADKHDQTPDALAALGYDAAMLMFDALMRAESFEGKDIAAAIAATQNFPGVTGSITIDENRNARKKGVVLQYKGGKQVFVTSVEPPK